MKRIGLLYLVCLALLGRSADAQTLDQARLAGRWSGSGVFFNAALQREFGAIPIVLECADDFVVSGRVGLSALQKPRLRKTRGVLEITGELDGVIVAKPELRKDHFILLITTQSDSVMVAEFHLKSNGWFDPRMREGRVVLTRAR